MDLNCEQEECQKEEVESEIDIRQELLTLSAQGKIKYTEKYLKKASESALEKIYQNQKKKQQEEVTEMLTKTLVEKFSGLLEQLNLVESGENLDQELVGNELFVRDLKGFITTVAPYIPYIGILTGGLSVTKHIYVNRQKKDCD